MEKQKIIGLLTLYLLSSPMVYAETELPVAVTKSKEMVVTANPLATAAGAKVLQRGGTAADAMVAVQTVLGLVEPQSSGLGGGAFIVYYDASTAETVTIDAREKAPASATENRFLDDEGNSIGFSAAWQSGLSVGVPGTPRMMEYMHQKYGKLNWKTLFQSANKLAKNGFPLTARTSDQVQGLLDRNISQGFTCEDRRYFRGQATIEYFANPVDCTAKPAGTIVVNPDYSDTLQKLRKDGADGFYTGPLAEQIVAAVQGDSPAGDMTLDDLANYNIVVREPVCLDYRGHNVCGMGPPSSGAIAVGQILGILENFDLTGDPLAVENVHLFTQAGRLAFADRGLYVADSDFVDVPVDALLDKAYLKTRADLINLGSDMGSADAGVPPEVLVSAAPYNVAKNSGTSHVSIVDSYGNALSMTTTIESSFGNGVMVNGFLLNNELTDFAFTPVSNEMPVANRVQGNKRPRSSMSPTIVFDGEGQVEFVTGSPGGSRIIGYTAQSIVNMIDFGLDPQEAINVPHYMNRNGTTDIETPIPGVTLDYDAEALALQLREIGHSDPSADLADRVVGIIEQTSGLSIIQIIREQQNDDPGEIDNELAEKDNNINGNNIYSGDINNHLNEVKNHLSSVDKHLSQFPFFQSIFSWISKFWNNPDPDPELQLIGGADQRRDGTVGGR